MNTVFILLILLMTEVVGFAQTTRVAILDFENISGLAKYDGLGKAMSSMLISDIEANVSPKRLQLVERAQIQKVLKEQNFQASGSVNKSTAVQAGQILGVNYLLVGDVYILNDQLIINARLTNTETGDIVFSKKQEGKTVAWLTLKTNIVKDLAASLSQPFTEPTIPDKEINVATITTFGNAVAAKDVGDVENAEIHIETVQDFNPEFKYIEEVSVQVKQLREEMSQIKKNVTILSGEPLKMSSDFLLQNDTNSALSLINSALENLRNDDPLKLNKKIFLLDQKANILISLGQYTETQKVIDSIIDIEPLFIDGIITRLRFYCLTKKYGLLDDEYNRILQNKEIFFSGKLKKTSKLFYSKRGWGYAIESGYTKGNKSESFYQYFEYSNIILELMKKNKAERNFILTWYDKSFKDLTSDKKVVYYLIFAKPFHFMMLHSNLLWVAANYKIDINDDHLELCDSFTNLYMQNDSINFKELMQQAGWKSRDPYFQDENYKFAFRKNWNFLNFRLNIAHIYFLRGNQNIAFSKYCKLINDYDKEYLQYEHEFFPDFTYVIYKDWKEAGLEPNFVFSNCSEK